MDKKLFKEYVREGLAAVFYAAGISPNPLPCENMPEFITVFPFNSFIGDYARWRTSCLFRFDQLASHSFSAPVVIHYRYFQMTSLYSCRSFVSNGHSFVPGPRKNKWIQSNVYVQECRAVSRATVYITSAQMTFSVFGSPRLSIL